MSKSFSTLIDECESELQDSANATWSAAELAIQVDNFVRRNKKYKYG